MKLSEIKGERVFDVIADVIEPIASIASDEDAAGLFKPGEIGEGMTPMQYFLGRVKASLPPLMKRHKTDLAAIMAAIEGTSTEQYLADVTLAKLLADLVELLNDDEFVAFFT